MLFEGMEMITNWQTGARRASHTRLNLREFMSQPTFTTPGPASMPPQRESTWFKYHQASSMEVITSWQTGT